MLKVDHSLCVLGILVCGDVCSSFSMSVCEQTPLCFDIGNSFCLLLCSLFSWLIIIPWWVNYYSFVNPSIDGP